MRRFLLPENREPFGQSSRQKSVAKPGLLRYCADMLADRIRAALLLFCISMTSLPLLAQQFVPKTITFSGDRQDTHGALLAVTGLKPGVAIGPANIQAATQKLSDTGMFAHVQFTFNGVDLHFVLTPEAGNLEPVRYVNFPWWSAADLTQAVAAKVPLFHGMVFPESQMQQQVADALTALVAARGVTATIRAVPSNNNAGQVAAVDFEITSPKVVVGAVHLQGSSAAFAAKIAKVEEAASGQPWNAAVQDQLQQALKAVYGEQGYLEANVAGLTHGAPQLSGDKLLVPVTATVSEGAQYYFAGLTLAGQPLPESVKALQHSPLHAGDVANEDLLRGLLLAIAQPYRAEGYLDAKVDAQPSLNRAQHTVAYTVTIAPGAVYHFHKLTITGLDPSQTAAVEKYWKIQPGDVFDGTYAAKLLLLNKKQLHNLDGWSADYKEFDNTTTHIVDLTMTFHKGGPLR
uniref:POTRA domain-containing protein n=1 Tax=Acidobacterium capsulatum TaxID=33075 RepID=A0A7V5CTB3_9BACT